MASSGFTGSLSLLFRHSFPTLTTLTLWSSKLNSDDLMALSQTSAEGKLPQLRDLDISGNNTLKISDFFTNSVKWNQLKTLTTGDWNFLNVEPQFLTSLEELRLSMPLGLDVPTLPPTTRRWSHLKVFRLVGWGELFEFFSKAFTVITVFHKSMLVQLKVVGKLKLVWH